MKSLARCSVFVLCLTLSVTGIGCSPQAPLPVTPKPTHGSTGAFTPSPGVPGTLWGTVYEHTTDGLRPFEGLSLRVDGMKYGRVSSSIILTTDSAGSFRVPDLIHDWGRVRAIPHPDYVVPCGWYGWNWGEPAVELHVISRNVVRTSGLPSDMPPFRSPNAGAFQPESVVSGTVTETSADGIRPLAGATVEHRDTGMGPGEPPMAYTVTDPEGRYALCRYNLEMNESPVLQFQKDGYGTEHSDITWPPQPIDVTLTRK